MKPKVSIGMTSGQLQLLFIPMGKATFRETVSCLHEGLGRQFWEFCSLFFYSEHDLWSAGSFSLSLGSFVLKTSHQLMLWGCKTFSRETNHSLCLWRAIQTLVLQRTLKIIIIIIIFGGCSCFYK